MFSLSYFSSEESRRGESALLAVAVVMAKSKLWSVALRNSRITDDASILLLTALPEFLETR